MRPHLASVRRVGKTYFTCHSHGTCSCFLRLKRRCRSVILENKNRLIVALAQDPGNGILETLDPKLETPSSLETTRVATMPAHPCGRDLANTKFMPWHLASQTKVFRGILGGNHQQVHHSGHREEEHCHRWSRPKMPLRTFQKSGFKTLILSW